MSHEEGWKDSLSTVGRSANNPHDALVELFESCLEDYQIMARAAQDALDALRESPYCNKALADEVYRCISTVDSYNPYHAVEGLRPALWDWEEEAAQRSPNPRRPALRSGRPYRRRR
jgi:hypothetical protein